MSNHSYIAPVNTLPTPPLAPSLEALPEALSEASSEVLPEVLLESVIERVDQLLMRHQELQRSHALLSEQVRSLAQERDSLKSRLSAARARVDVLLERLPENAGDNPQTAIRAG